MIAVHVIDYFLELYPGKRIAFLVPTRPLVEQQAENCKAHSRKKVIVQRLVGEDQAKWGQKEWTKCLETNHILLGTAESFRKVFVTERFLSVDQFSLFVFDECHNAVGNSPMAAVMRDAVVPHVDSTWSDLPRILGLTASIINGNLRNMEQKRRQLESLLLSIVFCPDVKPKLELGQFNQICWEKTCNGSIQLEAINKHIESALLHVGPIKDLQKLIRRCCHVFTELGTSSLFFYVEHVIVQQITDKANMLKEQTDCEHATYYADRLRQNLQSVRMGVNQLKLDLTSDPLIRSFLAQSDKLRCLLDLLVNLFEQHAADASYRGIVFVEQASLPSVIAKQVNDRFSGQNVKCGAVAGTSYQSEADRQNQLKLFHQGSLRVLVATNTLEEGIDVSACVFVIRYSQFSTTKAHIQGSGRARHPNAQIFYFANNPEDEREKESAMKRAAQNKALALTDSELKSAAATMNIKCVGKHPYPFSSTATAEGRVNVFNSKQIFNQYCSMCLGQSISPKTDLYTYTKINGNPRKILSEVRYPTRQGWQVMSKEEYDVFWSGVNLKDVFHHERAKKKTTSEREEMCFAYLVVVYLREANLLTPHNKVDQSARIDIKRACAIDEVQESALNLKNFVFN